MQRSSVTITFNFEELQVFQTFCLEMAKHDHRSHEEQRAIATHETRMQFHPWNAHAKPTLMSVSDVEEVLAFAAECFGGGN